MVLVEGEKLHVVCQIAFCPAVASDCNSSLVNLTCISQICDCNTSFGVLNLPEETG